jgi:nucleoside phosphorylase
MNVDCLILTAISKELSSLLFQFRHFRPVVSEQSLAFPYFETTAPNGMRIVAGMPSGMGQLEAAALTRDAIATFNPKAVLLVGIAGGMDKDIPLGDVVVSEQIVDYEIGKVTAEGFGPRWSVYRPDAHLLAKSKA